MTFCFYVIMGGFKARSPAPNSEGGSVIKMQPKTFLEMHLPWMDRSASSTFTMTEDHLLQLAERGHFLQISSRLIMDKSKADLLAKGLTICQVSWFIIQSISRRVSGLPLTLFELHTISQVLTALVLYTLWWYKPKDVSSATPVPVAGLQADLEEIISVAEKDDKDNDPPLEDTDKRGFSSRTSAHSKIEIGSILVGPFIVQVVCSAVHMVASPQWSNGSFHFPSQTEATLWTASGYILLGLSVLSLLELGVGYLIRRALPEFGMSGLQIINRYQSKAARLLGWGLVILWGVIHIPYGPLNFGSRMFLILESFISLRSIPLEAYFLPDWTTYIPHF